MSEFDVTKVPVAIPAEILSDMRQLAKSEAWHGASMESAIRAGRDDDAGNHAVSRRQKWEESFSSVLPLIPVAHGMLPDSDDYWPQTVGMTVDLAAGVAQISFRRKPGPRNKISRG